MSRPWGFTGTRRGQTHAQIVKVASLLVELGVTELHLGDCVGSDEETWQLCVDLGIRTIGHPPTVDKYRAFCEYDEEWEPKPYMTRNKDIAVEGEGGLIATPHEFHEIRRSGTWATVRMARDLNRLRFVVLPNGLLKPED